jgi:uncharacterized protein involved in tellurium resistance
VAAVQNTVNQLNINVKKLIRFLAGQKATDEAVVKPRESVVKTLL